MLTTWPPSGNHAHGLAGAVPALTGSPAALALHAAFFGFWIAINVSLIRNLRAFDPDPFEFMSVITSARQSSGPCSSSRARITSGRVTASARTSSSKFAMNTEMKIAYPHEKMDKLTEGRYETLVNMQKVLEKIR
jgi:uncharacterized membrane protein